MATTRGNKDTRKVIAELLRDGWTEVAGRKHIKLRSPGGTLLSISSSPSCRHAAENVLKDVQRILKNEQAS